MNGDSALYSLGSIATAGINSAANKSRQKYAFKKTMELQKQMQQWQEDMWNKANEYNLPINEVQRLLAAGINPALQFSNAGGGAAPVPSAASGSSIGVPSSNVPNLGEAVRAGQGQESLDIQSQVADSVVDRNHAEANKLRAEAEESGSRKNLNEVEYEIRNKPEYIEAMTSRPGLKNAIDSLDRDMRDLDYQYELGVYGYRLESSRLSLEQQKQSYDQQKLDYVTSLAQLRNIVADYDRIASYANYLDTLSGQSRVQAEVLYQDLDIRAGKALIGTLQRDAIQYCVDHGVNDTVTGEITSFIDALAQEYGAKVLDGVYSSRSSAESAYQEDLYQSQHGRERRALEQELVRRKANYYRTAQWSMSINTAANFIETAVDTGMAVATRGASKVAPTMATPKAGPERMPLSEDAISVIRKVLSETKGRLTY